MSRLFSFLFCGCGLPGKDKQTRMTIPNPYYVETTRNKAEEDEEEKDVSEENKVIEPRKVIRTDYSEEVDEHIAWSDTIPFTFPIQGGRVIKVYDGDTITIAAKLPYDNSPLYRLSVRLNGIDTPEIKGHRLDEKEAAKIARDKLHEITFQKNVVLKNIQSEKYGRILADVYLDKLHLNQFMIDHRYALPYDGGTKTYPVSWIRYQQKGEMY